jgi:hypothetical protein
MSLVTHLLAFINIPKFLLKDGPATAIVRCLGILLTLIFTWLAFKIRDIDGFPTHVGSLSILPATCFETANGSSPLNSTYFTTHNATEILLSSGSSGASFEYKYYFGSLAATSILAAIVFPWSCIESWNDYGFWSFAFWVSRIVFTIPAVAIAYIATEKYFNLRDTMEVNAWYLANKENQYAFAQIVSLALLASTGLGVAKALWGKFSFFWCWES